MKKIRFAVALLLSAILLSVLAVSAVSAESTNGWRVDDDGALRYYTDGQYATGIKSVGGYVYEFGSDGAYIGIHDAHQSIGTAGVPSTQAYKDALAALGSSKIYGYYTFDPGESYKSTSYVASNRWGLGDQHADLDKETVAGNVYTKNSIFTSVANKIMALL